MAAAPAAPSTGRRLWGYVRPRGLVWAAGAVLALRSATEIGSVLVASQLADTQRLGGVISLAAIEPTIAELLVCGLLLALTEFGIMYLCDYLAQVAIRDLRADLFGHVQRLSLSYFEDASTGLLVSRATNDLNVLQTRLSFELSNLLRCPVVLAALLVAMLAKSWVLTLVVVAALSMLAPLLSGATRLMRVHTGNMQDRMAELTARLQESIAGIRVVQAFGAADFEIARFGAANVATRRAIMRTVRVKSALRPLIHLVGLLGVFLVLIMGFVGVTHLGIRPDAVVLVIISLLVMTNHFKDYGKARLALSESLAAADKVFAVIDTPPDIVDAPAAVALSDCRGRLCFEGVGFRYRSGAPVLADVDVVVEPGQVVALVGSSGAGKTSLANLVPRLYDVTAGRLLVDGHDVRTVTLASLRAQIGIVPQQTVLFRGTVAENIAYGKPSATRDEIAAAAAAANAAGFIADFPEGYDTELGERGAKLSGGQAQRIAIARAILRDPRILILDEATSSLDTESEALVQEALERLMRHRTTLVIAHRLSTITNADLILVLEAGRIVERGSHAELMARPEGVYRRMVLLQTGVEP
jgi:subfamily B ATP-binding cassette protein MsbA